MLQRVVCFVASLFTAAGCAPARNDAPIETAPGAFALKELRSQETDEGTIQTWLATAGATGEKPFTFQLEVLLKEPAAGQHFSFSKGAIVRQSGMDGAHFLNEVAHAIEASAPVPVDSERVDRLDFPTAILGLSLSREGDGSNVVAGSFSSDPPGDWIALKLFLADGEGEVYLNLNPVLGHG